MDRCFVNSLSGDYEVYNGLAALIGHDGILFGEFLESRDYELMLVVI